MILVDANLLVYASLTDAREHAAARDWLQESLSATQRVGLPWPSLLAFVRIVTNPRVARSPLGIVPAWNQVEAWLSCSPAWIPSATEQHSDVLGRLLATRGLGSNDVPDAHLAALAIEHGLTLASVDSGFARFPGLRSENPLA